MCHKGRPRRRRRRHRRFGSRVRTCCVTYILGIENVEGRSEKARTHLLRGVT